MLLSSWGLKMFEVKTFHVRDSSYEDIIRTVRNQILNYEKK